MSESSLQVSFINWMRAALPEVTVWHVYNENSVNKIQGKIKKDRGVLAGVHDNHLIWQGRNFATIELKDPNKPKSANKYSDKQSEFAIKMDEAGFPHFCCQSGGQIEAAIVALGLRPKFRFPSCLDRSARQMLYAQLIDINRP